MKMMEKLKKEMKQKQTMKMNKKQKPTANWVTKMLAQFWMEQETMVELSMASSILD